MKHVFPGQKIGHSGTLDPLATGMMILGIGKGTKKLTSLIGLDKEYETTIDFAKMSDTRDLQYWDYYEEYPLVENKKGIIINSQERIAPPLETIEALLQQLIPESLLPLPAFSAKKKEGKRLYELARKGKGIEEERVMRVMEYNVLNYNFPILSLRLKVGSGSYIRSISYRLGQQLSLGGILIQLRRTSVGEWNFENTGVDQEVEYTMRGRSGVLKYGILEE
ncbi:MAG: tRNA pseudouridine(55) synthase [Candidatus Absconditabacteria bacterium]|nr:tRNA pseudouridine(55) synthase [Candidatus Absconditabacteria bacterium]